MYCCYICYLLSCISVALLLLMCCALLSLWRQTDFLVQTMTKWYSMGECVCGGGGGSNGVDSTYVVRAESELVNDLVLCGICFMRLNVGLCHSFAIFVH
jgi:hypothetical protein